ncbi:MAG: methylenetetrahydrofolate reductase [Acidimicrobiales bacterium]|nr:methylenetetrahydrofolate reductase [Acidimicrobiales bacterium]
MSATAYSFRRGPRAITDPFVRGLVADMTYELVPMKSLAARLPDLPANARISVTASPVKSLEETLDVCAELLDLGHRPVPHLAARMVADADQVAAIAARCKRLGLTEVFCIGGDREEPGAYPDAMAFLRELLDVAAGDITTVGVGSYPDGHAFIPEEALRAALVEKQELFAAAGVDGHATTQMCFSADTIRTWLRAERAAGLTLPVHLGLPGVVDRTKLMTMGMRVGVGASLRYLKKNKAGLTRLFASPGYNPSALVDPLGGDFETLGIAGLHTYTFNQVAATHEWQRAVLG